MKGPTGAISSSGLPMSSKAAEAELISRATQTAIVAARSILMSGGSEEVALKTAKAAAESVLNPTGSDSETVSGRSTTLGVSFGGKKRKAKRQAEVVASMALMSATSSNPNSSNAMNERENSFTNQMYGHHIITVRQQDEPSVLSGSITSRPPKPPTPKSNPPKSKYFFFGGSKKEDEAREQPATSRSVGPSYSSVRTKGSALSNANRSQKSAQSKRPPIPHRKNNPKPRKAEKEQKIIPTLDSKSLSESSTMDSHMQCSVDDSSLQRGSESEDESDDESETMRSRVHENRRQSKLLHVESEEKTSWSVGDMLVRPLTATLNLMTCGQLANGDAAGDVDVLASYGGRRCGGVQSPAFDRRDDTFDSEYENGKRYRDSDFGTSYSESTMHARSDLTDDSEGEIQVRSSIRETMENIVAKSKMSYRKSKLKDEKRWSSFEKASSPRGRIASPRRSSITSPKRGSVASPRNGRRKQSSKSSIQPKRGMSKRASSFFKRK